MIKICLCDDIPVQLCMLEDMVRDYCTEREIITTVSTFENGTNVIDYVSKNGFFDIYILDMIMPGIKGIDVAKELRKLGDNGRIIYLTATSEYAVDSYQVGAFFYLLKPLDRKTMYEVLDKACTEVTREQLSRLRAGFNDRRIEVRMRAGKTLVRLADILYVNIVNRGLCYHIIDGSCIETPMLRVPFAEAVNEITDTKGFLTAGAHLVINMINITQITKNSIVFANGEELFPSRSALSYVNEEIKKYNDGLNI